MPSLALLPIKPKLGRSPTSLTSRDDSRLLPPSKVTGSMPAKQTTAQPPSSALVPPEPNSATCTSGELQPHHDVDARREDGEGLSETQRISEQTEEGSSQRAAGNLSAARVSRAQGRGIGRLRNHEKGTATQRARDKAHNDAVLAQASGGQESAQAKDEVNAPMRAQENGVQYSLTFFL